MDDVADASSQKAAEKGKKKLCDMTPTSGGYKKSEGTGVFLGGRYSRAKVIEFGGLSEEVALGIRSSARIRAQPNADATQMDRAKLRAKEKDFDYSGTDLIHEFTIASLSNDEVVARATKLGVSLGKSPSQIENSVDLLKDVDLNRTLIMLKKKDALLSTIDNDAESLVLNQAISLAGDLLDEEAIAAADHKDPPVKVKDARFSRVRKKKVVGDVSTVRRSARLKKNF